MFVLTWELMYSLLVSCFNMICFVDTCFVVVIHFFNLRFSLVVDNIIRLQLISYFIHVY